MHAVIRRTDLAKLVKSVKALSGTDLAISMYSDAWRMCVTDSAHVAMVVADLFPGTNITDYALEVEGDRLDIVLPLGKVSIVLDIMDSDEIVMDFVEGSGSVMFSANGISKSIRTGGLVPENQVPDHSTWPTVMVTMDVSRASRVVRKSMEVSDLVEFDTGPDGTRIALHGDVEGVEVSDPEARSDDGMNHRSTFPTDYMNEALGLFADGPALIHIGTDCPFRIVRSEPFPLTFILAPCILEGA